MLLLRSGWIDSKVTKKSRQKKASACKPTHGPLFWGQLLAYQLCVSLTQSLTFSIIDPC
jgi:hypothetical protein